MTKLIRAERRLRDVLADTSITEAERDHELALMYSDKRAQIRQQCIDIDAADHPDDRDADVVAELTRDLRYMERESDAIWKAIANRATS